MQVAIGNYNDRVHSTIKCSPNEANNKTDIESIIQEVNKNKNHIIHKRNKSRQDYIEN